MKLNIVVLAKQVPDTHNVGEDAMTPEGTINRSALPAVFNPEDLNALEQALRLKDDNLTDCYYKLLVFFMHISTRPGRKSARPIYLCTLFFF